MRVDSCTSVSRERCDIPSNNLSTGSGLNLKLNITLHWLQSRPKTQYHTPKQALKSSQYIMGTVICTHNTTQESCIKLSWVLIFCLLTYDSCIESDTHTQLKLHTHIHRTTVSEKASWGVTPDSTTKILASASPTILAWPRDSSKEGGCLVSIIYSTSLLGNRRYS